MGIVMAVAVILCLWGGGELTEQEKQAVDKAYDACAHKVDEAANELEKWYMSYSNGSTKEAAEELIGWKAKWKAVTGSQEERDAHAREVMSKHLFTEEAAEKQVAHQMGVVLLAWQHVEDELAMETNCPALSVKSRAGSATGEGAAKPSDEILKNEMVNTVYREALSIAGAEAAAVVATQLAASAGILGTEAVLSWETLGVGLAASLVVDAALGWIMDSEGKIQKILDDQVKNTATEQKKRFREMMMTVLDARRKEWEKQIK